MNMIDYGCQMQDAKLAALKAQAQVTTVEAVKERSHSSSQALDLITYYERVGLIGKIEDALNRLEK